MTDRALVVRVVFSLFLAAGLAAPIGARGEAVLEPTVGDAPPQPAPEADQGQRDAGAPTPAKPPGGEPGSHIKTITSQEAAGILGKEVIGAAGENIGMVVDVLIDSEGAPRAAVIDFGGFLGVGSRKIAVEWTLLQFRPGDHYAPILLDVTGEDIRQAPEFRPSDTGPRVVVAPPPPPPLPAGPPPSLDTLPVDDGAPPADGPPPADGLPPADSPPPAAAGDAAPDASQPEDMSQDGQPEAEPLGDAAPAPVMRPPDQSHRPGGPVAEPRSGEDPAPLPAPPAPTASPDARQ